MMFSGWESEMNKINDGARLAPAMLKVNIKRFLSRSLAGQIRFDSLQAMIQEVYFESSCLSKDL